MQVRDVELTLEQASDLLAEKSGRGHISGDPLRILRHGQSLDLPVYWCNTTGMFSVLVGFRGEVPDSTVSGRWMRLNTHDLARLQLVETIRVSMFDLEDDDFERLIEVGSLDEGGAPDGFRALFDYRIDPQSNLTMPVDAVDVHRNQVFVFERDVLELADSVAHPEPAPAGVKGKRWTDEFKAEVQAFRKVFGTKAAAEKFGVAESLIRRHLPSEDPPPKGYGAFNQGTRGLR